jgi:hypothetical protein
MHMQTKGHTSLRKINAATRSAASAAISIVVKHNAAASPNLSHNVVNHLSRLTTHLSRLNRGSRIVMVVIAVADSVVVTTVVAADSAADIVVAAAVATAAAEDTKI